MNYGIEFHGKVFTPDGISNIPPNEVEERNQAVDAAVLEAWVNSPNEFSVYIDGESVTSWMGEKMGTVLYRSEFHNNFGGVTECIRFKGTNGSEYYGRKSRDWSQLLNCRKCAR